MKRLSNVCKILSLCAFFLLPASAHAARYTCSGNISLLTETTANGSTAHVVQMSNDNCSTLCTSGSLRRGYVEFYEKQLYAALLAASINGGVWQIEFESAATAKGSSVYGMYSCKIESVFK